MAESRRYVISAVAFRREGPSHASVINAILVFYRETELAALDAGRAWLDENRPARDGYQHFLAVADIDSVEE